MATNLVNFRQEYGRYTRYFQEIKKTYAKHPEVRRGIELLLTLLAISFFTVFAIRPTVNTIAELLSTIRTQEEISAKLDQKIKNLTTAKNLYTQEQANIALLDEGLTKTAFPEKYLRQIEGLAGVSNVTISSFNLDEVQLIGKPDAAVAKERDKSLPEGIEEQNTTFAVSGNYTAVISFLEAVEKLRIPFTVSSFSLSPASDTGNSNFILNFSGFFPYSLNAE